MTQIRHLSCTILGAKEGV